MAALRLNFSRLIFICCCVSLFNLTPGIDIEIELSFILTSLVPLYPLSHIASSITLSPTLEIALAKIVNSGDRILNYLIRNILLKYPMARIKRIAIPNTP